MAIHSIHSAYNLIRSADHIDPATNKKMEVPVTLEPCGHVVDYQPFIEYNERRSDLTKVMNPSFRFCPIGSCQQQVKKAISNKALASEIQIMNLVPAEAILQRQEGLRLMEGGKFKDAYPYFIRALRLNPQDSDARTYLDFCLDQLSTDSDIVLEQHGDAEALYNLGLIHEEGRGTAICLITAFKWYSAAADKGYADAQYKLAKMHEKKNSQDDAVNWLMKAARQGHGRAAFKMGKRFEEGKGIEQSYDEALQMYIIAAARGNEQAAFKVGQFYEEGLGCVKSDEKTFQWYKNAAEHGHGEAAHKLARMYDLGQKGVVQSDEMALFWYQKAGDRGISSAKTRASEMEAKRLGVQKTSPLHDFVSWIGNQLTTRNGV